MSARISRAVAAAISGAIAAKLPAATVADSLESRDRLAQVGTVRWRHNKREIPRPASFSCDQGSFQQLALPINHTAGIKLDADPVTPSSAWAYFGWGSAAPAPSSPTGREVVVDVCTSLSRMSEESSLAGAPHRVPASKLVVALTKLVSFFPHIFPHGSLFISHIRRTVERHNEQILEKTARSSSTLADARARDLYTCGKRFDCVIERSKAWEDVLDVRDVVEWEMRECGRSNALKSRLSAVHALQWSMRLLTFMLAYMDAMLDGTAMSQRSPSFGGERRKKTPNQAAREAYDLAYRPFHAFWQRSLANVGISFITHNRWALISQLGFTSEEEAVEDLARCAASLRPVVMQLQAFFVEHGIAGPESVHAAESESGEH